MQQPSFSSTQGQAPCCLCSSFASLSVLSRKMAVYLVKGWKLSAASVNPHTRLLSELSADHLRTVAQQASCSRRGQTLLTEMHALAADF